MVSTDKKGISLFVEECVKQGLKKVVCSPGSRNAPLVISFDEHPLIDTVVIHDERSAGFFAMGMALELSEPVAVVCTSGSAMLNYYPAVAEAYYQCIPLLVISADRPEEWVDHGDGQTIVQSHVYSNHIRKEISISESIDSEMDRLKMVEQVDDLFGACNGSWKGPGHVNVPLTEPLYNTVEIADVGPVEYYDRKLIKDSLSEEEKGIVQNGWGQFKKKMIICGQQTLDRQTLNCLKELAADSSIAVLVENTSNLQDAKFIHCIDRTLAGIKESEIEQFQPDLLITIGGAVISKKIKKFLRDVEGLTHWRIGVEFPEMDTYRAKRKAFRVSSHSFMGSILEMKLPMHASTFGNKWKQLDYIIQDKLIGYWESCPYSDLAIFETVLDFIPEGSNLHMGNSSVVRYCQLFDPIKSITYYSNRGTSGIDGCTSTAAGVSSVSPKKCNVLLTGDVSFFYDSNALWNDYLTDNLRIILINNEGGGIFKIIEGPNLTNQLEKYFEAKHQHSAKYVAKAFGIEYSKVGTIEELEQSMEWLYADSDNGRPKLLEIFTPSDVNDKVLKDFFNSIKFN